jgi:hypothetical protein
MVFGSTYVERLIPNKTDALTFIEGTSKSVEKWARVVVNDQDMEKAGISEWMVRRLDHFQPLPLSFTSQD